MTVLGRLRLEDLEFETIFRYITRWPICLSVSIYLTHRYTCMCTHPMSDNSFPHHDSARVPAPYFCPPTESLHSSGSQTTVHFHFTKGKLKLSNNTIS